MKLRVALNALVFLILFMKPYTKSKELERVNSTTSNHVNFTKRDSQTISALHNIHKKHQVNNSLKSENKNKSENYENYLHEGIMQFLFPDTSETNQSIPKITSKIKSTKIQKNINSKPRKSKNKRKSSTKSKPKNKARVFKDTREDIMHYKLIDNMMFKPLESNNSASIVFSDESEITQDDVDQAIAGRDGSCIAIPIKRKKDIYKEFLRWAHTHEKNERRAKIEKEIIQKYKNNTTHIITKAKDLSNMTSKIRSFKTNKAGSNRSSSTVHNNILSQTKVSFQDGMPIKNTEVGEHSTISINKAKGSSQNYQQGHSKNTKHKGSDEPKMFKAKSVELTYEPDFLDKLHNTVKEHADANKKVKKKKRKKQKLRQTYEGNPADISTNDYSAQETFMMNTQKEAMGRRYYQMFVNKTASDFWDNNTLETTKMLEFLIPLGEHLHKTLDDPLPNQGQNLMTDLKMYKTELEKFIELVKKDKAGTRNDAVALIEEPYDHVCETKYSEDEVKIMFDWNEEEFKQFETLLEETREMWFDLQLFHHCYQFVSASAESYVDPYNYTKEERDEIIRNNTWYQSPTQ